MKSRLAGWKTQVHRLAASGGMGDLAALVTSQVLVKLIALLGSIVAIRAIGADVLGQAAQATFLAGALFQLFGLGIEIMGPQMISAAAAETKESVALSLLGMRIAACSLSLLLIPLVTIYSAWRAHSALELSSVGVAVCGAATMLCNNAGSPQFIAQGLGKVRTLVLPQVVSALVVLTGHWFITLRFLRADVFLLVQATGALVYMILVLYVLRLNPRRFSRSAWSTTWAGLATAPVRSAWFLGIATYITNDGGLILMAILCSRVQLGDVNAAVTLIAGVWGALMWVSYVTYSRQLLWSRMGVEVFCRYQIKALHLAWFFGCVTGLAVLFLGQYPSHLVLGAKFVSAPKFFAVLCSALFFMIPSSVMSGAMSAFSRNRAQARIYAMSAALSVPCYLVALLLFGPMGIAWARLVLLGVVTSLQYRAYRSFMQELHATPKARDPALNLLPEAATSLVVGEGL